MRKVSFLIHGCPVCPYSAARHGTLLDDMGLRNIDAPVCGGAIKAAAGQLSVMAAGRKEDIDACQPIFDAIAAKLYRLGERPGQGSTVKMINQLLAGVHIAVSAEAMAFGIRSGADPAAPYDVICNSPGASWLFMNCVPPMQVGSRS